jgi:hypothetical protein
MDEYNSALLIAYREDIQELRDEIRSLRERLVTLEGNRKGTRGALRSVLPPVSIILLMLAVTALFYLGPAVIENRAEELIQGDLSLTESSLEEVVAADVEMVLTEDLEFQETLGELVMLAVADAVTNAEEAAEQAEAAVSEAMESVEEAEESVQDAETSAEEAVEAEEAAANGTGDSS